MPPQLRLDDARVQRDSGDARRRQALVQLHCMQDVCGLGLAVGREGLVAAGSGEHRVVEHDAGQPVRIGRQVHDAGRRAGKQRGHQCSRENKVAQVVCAQLPSRGRHKRRLLVDNAL